MSERHDRIARAFAHAQDYDRHARIQHEIAADLAARILALDLPAAPRVLEIGCGTGFLTEALVQGGLDGDWLVTDIAPDMLARCRDRLGKRRVARDCFRFAELDGEYGVADGGPFDLICSSLAVQWFDDAPAALARMAGWLAPGGHLMVTTLGPGSFAEWRAAHAALGLGAGTPPFAPVDAFAALAPATLDVRDWREHHVDARAFLHAVKAIGAGTAAPGHRPLAPAALRRVMAEFDRRGGEVTYEVVTCHVHRAMA